MIQLQTELDMLPMQSILRRKHTLLNIGQIEFCIWKIVPLYNITWGERVSSGARLADRPRMDVQIASI